MSKTWEMDVNKDIEIHAFMHRSYDTTADLLYTALNGFDLLLL